MALHVLYVALGFHASHLQALWTSDGYSTVRSGQLGTLDLGGEHTSEVEALLAAPLVGLDTASASAGEEDLGVDSGVALETDGEANFSMGMHAHRFTRRKNTTDEKCSASVPRHSCVQELAKNRNVVRRELHACTGVFCTPYSKYIQASRDAQIV